MKRIALFACALIAAAPALADPPIGSRLGSNVRNAAAPQDEQSAALVAHQIAKCVVSKRKPAVERFLSAPDRAALEKANGSIWSGSLTCDPLATDNDLVEGHQVSWSTDLLRGMLAEEMLRRRPIVDLAAMPFRQGRYQRAWFALSGRNAAIDEMSACLADTTPQGISGVLATKAYSAEEKQAFAAVMPLMGQCLAIGAKLTGNRQSLRAALADALYQRLLNPAASLAPLPESVKK